MSTPANSNSACSWEELSMALNTLSTMQDVVRTMSIKYGMCNKTIMQRGLVATQVLEWFADDLLGMDKEIKKSQSGEFGGDIQ